MASEKITHARAGEKLAQTFLVAQGYQIVNRNWRYKQLELDIVCFQGETLVFVEVKTRSDSSYGTASEALTAQKQKKMLKAVSNYLSLYNLWDRSCRLDLVAVHLGQSQCEIIHEKNALEFAYTLGGFSSYWQPW